MRNIESNHVKLISTDKQSVRDQAAKDYLNGKIDAEEYYDTVVKNSPDYRKLAAELAERKLDAQSSKFASFARKFFM